jgi:hypothetical protein
VGGKEGKAEGKAAEAGRIVWLIQSLMTIYECFIFSSCINVWCDD